MTIEPDHTEILGSALKSRAHRAYRALWNANQEYRQLMAVFDELATELPHIDLVEGTQHIERIHLALTNRPLIAIDTLETGIDRTETYLPVHPESVDGIEIHGKALQDIGLGIIRDTTYIADGRYYPDDPSTIDRDSSAFDAIYSAAVTVIGSGEVISTAVNEGFRIDANEYLLRLVGDWEGT